MRPSRGSVVHGIARARRGAVETFSGVTGSVVVAGAVVVCATGDGYEVVGKVEDGGEKEHGEGEEEDGVYEDISFGLNYSQWEVGKR